ncbi:B12-binding domain-containing radical SAM protein [Rhodoferax antarcticus]|uniref:B12-binding domain-containing radical SAM protein n=1 Tax=Rhodoferax antarcticus TaxID=81479 RepID=UPI002224B939|nr:DUF4080 domain-containing protein [Rhodoferax antarcticus]MCW2311028.1 hypothetical protein [Rhodoferax antarcticus]
MHKPANGARIVLAMLNARYIHASLGLRYLLANLDSHGSAGLRAQAVLREYTIARPAHEVVADLLATLDAASTASPTSSASPALAGQTASADQGAATDPAGSSVPAALAGSTEPIADLAARPAPKQIVGFGVYIWNVTQTLEVIRLLKAARPSVIVVLGGPEVSYEIDQQTITKLADFVVTGWGDVSFARLCRALINGPQPLMRVIPGVQPDLADICLPYLEYSDADLANRLLYVQASRGCPFKCEFCLSALDKTAWAFALDRVLAALDALYQRGARNFKFVDRTFNLKIDTAVRILQFFLDKLPRDSAVLESDTNAGARPDGDAPHDLNSADNRQLFLHFEVIPDHLPERLREHLVQFPPGVLQLEVGVQSFNEPVQQTMSRRQDNAATDANLRWLLAHTHAHLHADLIFGLPGETLQSFADGFDQLLAIGPHEIQLGILKRLRGAPIDRHTVTHGMVYQTKPPYQVLQTGVIDADTVLRFTRFARYWDVLANAGRFAQTLALLLSQAPGPSPFWRFWALSERFWQHLATTHGLTPEVLVDALFDDLSQHLPPELVRQTLLADYLASGARANPRALQGLLPRTAPAPVKVARLLATRQERHRMLLSD